MLLTGSSWTLSPGPENLNGFTISVTITDAERDSNGAIVSSGGSVDESTKKIVTSVSWINPLTSAVSATSFFTRNKNASYTETLDSQFNNGTLDNVQVTNVSGGEVKLINNNKAKWCSPAFSTSTIDLPDGPPVAVAATASGSTSVPNDVYVDRAHSSWLEVLITTGVVGFIFYISFVLLLFNRMSWDDQFSKAVTIALILYLINAQVNVTSVAQDALFWVLGAVVVANFNSRMSAD